MSMLVLLELTETPPTTDVIHVHHSVLLVPVLLSTNVTVVQDPSP